MGDRKSVLLSQRQLGGLLWAGMVSPLIRVVPGAMVAAAGGAAWISALLCIPAAVLTGLCAAGVLRGRKADEGPGELLCRGLGVVPGRMISGAMGAWFVFYGGFVLRAGADRFVSAMYPDSPDWAFMVVMALLILPVGTGRPKTLARCAQIITPVLWGVFALVFVFCLPDVDLKSLQPPAELHASDVLRGAVPMLCALGTGVFGVFLAGETEPGPLGRAFVGPLAAAAGLGALLCLTTVGVFGAELAGQMRYPFFVMLRGVRVFDLLERIEALVVVQWAAVDFLLLGTLLQLSARCLTLAVRGPGAAPGRGVAYLCAGAGFACGRLCAPSSFALRSLGLRLITPVTGALALALLTVCRASIGLQQKKRQ